MAIYLWGQLQSLYMSISFNFPALETDVSVAIGGEIFDRQWECSCGFFFLLKLFTGN